MTAARPERWRSSPAGLVALVVPALVACDSRTTAPDGGSGDAARGATDAAWALIDAAAPALAPDAAAADGGPSDAGVAEDAAADAAPVDALHTYRRVLHIGDSMVGFRFGLTRALGAAFEADGAKFFSIPVTSAGVQSFEKGTELDDAIKKTRPDLVLITLGANNATSPAPEYLVPAIKKVVKKVGVGPRRACIWMGPPLWKEDKVGFLAVLRKSVAPCLFFDASPLDIERMSDHIHPTNKGGQVWADGLLAFARAELPPLVAAPAPRQ